MENIKKVNDNYLIEIVKTNEISILTSGKRGEILDNNNPTQYELITKINNSWGNFNNRIGEKANLLSDLERKGLKKSKQYKQIEKERDNIYIERQKEFKNTIIYENQIRLYDGIEKGFNFNVYPIKDRLLITILNEDNKEINFIKILPSIWININPHFLNTILTILIIASKKTCIFKTTYEELKSLWAIDGREFFNRMNDFKKSLEQLKECILDLPITILDNGERIRPNGAIIIYSETKKGFKITFNEDYYKYLINSGFLKKINKNILKQSFTDRQLNLYLSILDNIAMRRTRADNYEDKNPYLFTRNDLLRIGGYKTDSFLKNVCKDSKKLKIKKIKEHMKLINDLKIIANPIKENDKTIKRENQLLFISDINISVKKFTIMDIHNENRNIESDIEEFKEHNKTNKTNLTK